MGGVNGVKRDIIIINIYFFLFLSTLFCRASVASALRPANSLCELLHCKTPLWQLQHSLSSDDQSCRFSESRPARFFVDLKYLSTFQCCHQVLETKKKNLDFGVCPRQKCLGCLSKETRKCCMVFAESRSHLSTESLSANQSLACCYVTTMY